MATFTVNGQTVQAEKNQKLIRFLRDELRLTSVKDGCSEGACGTCHVLIDGKATKACVPSTDKLEGKTILTVEGLSDWEKDVYTYAFGKAGAVQCGFCIPGMVISAKALLDANPAPTREEAAFAIRNNICRCTGYVKIIDGILLAAEIFRNGKLPEEKKTGYGVGERAVRVDVAEKVQGYGKYPDDLYVDGMLYASAVRSKYPRARVLAIHKEKAEALPGVVGVYTAEDIPGEIKVGHLQQDWDAMIPAGRITHYLGDAICLVAAETKEALEQAKALVEIDYEPLKPVFSPTYASQPFAPLVHESGNLLCEKHVSRGNADQAIRDADYVLMYHYETPYTEHAFLEPECAVAYPDEDGLTILSTDQGAYDTAREVSRLLGLPKEKIHVTNMLVGGGFGGKEDMTVQHHAALVAYLTGRPVKVKLSRKESMLVHPKRHPMKVTITMGCNRDGLIQGVKAEVVADTGAYASLGGPVLERACTHAAGPYHYENFEITGKAYYTNNPPAGAFRGFGVTQTCYAMEMTLTKMAHELGISPWEIRYRNAIRPGQTLPNGQIAPPSTGLVETLEAVKDICEQNKNVGIACAMKNAGVGVGIPDTGRCIVAVKDGKLHIRSGASCIGQGLGTVLTQIVCTMLHCEREDVVYEAANTVNAPDSGTTSGSRRRSLPAGLSEAARGGGRRCEGVRLFRHRAPAGHGIAARRQQQRHGRHRAARGGERGLESARGTGVLRRIPRQDRPAGRAERGKSHQPRRLRLCYPCVCAQRRRNDPRDRRGALRRQGDQSALLRGADRGRRHHGARLHADGALSALRLHPQRKVRYAGIVPRRSGAAHPQHSGGEGGAGHGLRRHRHRRDHDHPDGSRRGGRVLRARRRDAHQPSADENAV